MIRGHIDFVSRTRVEGWIASGQVRLTGAAVLAFIDETCVGGGKVDLFRQDLANAGLGDGVVGFSFPVAMEPGHDPRILDIRLDGGSVVLKQARSCLVPREDVGEDRRRQGREPASLSFMLARGWLTRPQYDALRALSQLGIHGEALHFAPHQRSATQRCDAAALTAADLIELHVLQPVELEIRDGVRPSDLGDLRREVRAAYPFVPPVVGLWAPVARHLDYCEGSHRPGASVEPGGAIEHLFGGGQLLMLDLDGQCSLSRIDGEAGFAAFLPSRPRL